MLHTSVQLELGDLFINKFYSERHQAQALQVWLLVKGSNSNSLMWEQVRDWFRLAFFALIVPDQGPKVGPDEKTSHPKLQMRVLGF